MFTRTAHVHPDDIRAVLSKMIDADVEHFEIDDDRGGTGAWAVIVDGDKVTAGKFRKAVGRKASVTLDKW